jgi:cellulose synthase/poly-beta-1,6-N-acetylglucosamine synthase-like glycosyltransferase
MNEFIGLIKYVGSFFNLLLLFLGGYLLVISMFAWRRKIEPKTDIKATYSFALVVAAHNEETVIENLIDNLKNLKYPKDRYDIFVVADNCSDKTGEIAKKSGAFVYERNSKQKEGKGNALKWMLGILSGLKKKYDAVCVFDADNLVSDEFLNEINKKMNEGYKVVQGYRDIKNPFDSWITVSYAITYWISNRLFQLPRHYLGMNSILTGSGYAICMDILNEMRWEVTSLTEDMEFTIQFMLKGIKIGWAHQAVIYDEQPLSLYESWIQRKRWMQGHAHCIVKYTKAVCLKLVRNKSLAAFDSLFILISPLITLFGSLNLLLNAVINIFLQTGNTKFYIYLFLGMSAAAYLLQSLYFLVFISLEKRIKPMLLLGLLIFPVFNLTWAPIIIQGFLDRNKNEWIHIAHTRDISIYQLHD